MFVLALGSASAETASTVDVRARMSWLEDCYELYQAAISAINAEMAASMEFGDCAINPHECTTEKLHALALSLSKARKAASDARQAFENGECEGSGLELP